MTAARLSDAHWTIGREDARKLRTIMAPRHPNRAWAELSNEKECNRWNSGCRLPCMLELKYAR